MSVVAAQIFGEAGTAESPVGQLFEVAGLVSGGLVVSCVYAAATTQLAQAARRQLQHREHQHLTRETMRRLDLPRHMQQLVTSCAPPSAPKGPSHLPRAAPAPNDVCVRLPCGRL